MKDCMNWLEKRSWEMSDKKLLPCPFCGSEAKLEAEPIGKGKFIYSVSCSNEECVTMRSYRITEETAIDDWNNRKTFKLIERLKREHEAAKEEVTE